MERERRLVVTAAGVAAVVLAERVRLPLYDQAGARSLVEAFPGAGEAVRLLSVFALGLAPFVSAFVLVEITALLVPRWRTLRVGGPEARGRLGRAALVTGLLLCVVQGARDRGRRLRLALQPAGPGGAGVVAPAWRLAARSCPWTCWCRRSGARRRRPAGASPARGAGGGAPLKSVTSPSCS